ncbi:MAG: bifunctional proline dehydrogenase/L-glutamate gamma-semialdehyde dehydrogenase, partial [Pseudomonadota bacterium]
MDNHSDRDLVAEAVDQAQKWLKRSEQLMTSAERKVQKRMAGLADRPLDRVILSGLIDQGFRSRNPARAADQISFILDRYPAPDFFSPLEKALVRIFRILAPFLPGLLVPMVVRRIMSETSAWILPGEKDRLYTHLDRRTREGVRMNINHLGEAVLGEDEASTRLTHYLEDLASPSVECISVKISTLCPQIQPLAFEYTVTLLVGHLSTLYRAAAASSFTGKDGTGAPKLVYLDMEEYKDLELTAEAFKRTLARQEFHNYQAGMALQAYLPDSARIQRELTEWARERVAEGGSPIRIRVVKGANMEMERLESSLRNWPLAPYGTKGETDANYKRMVEYGLRPENINAVRLGIASHNIFDLALAHRLAAVNGVSEHLSIEMLEGMADHIRRAVGEDVPDCLLYAPVAGREQFINAIAYLFRRLDENTGRGNFLRYAPTLKPGTREWKLLLDQFVSSWEKRHLADQRPNRRQDRTTEDPGERKGSLHTGTFTNEPDTDWSLRANREWAGQIRHKWMSRPDEKPKMVPLVVAGREIHGGRNIRESNDPSRINDKVCIVCCAMANEGDISEAVAAARDDPDGWREMDLDRRRTVLSKVAVELRRARGDLIGAAAAETGKVFTEADPEVSEAVDFAEFYPWSAALFDNLESVSCRGRGVGVVISPWNFPIAIPAGGILASLAAGNTVIFKPASTAVLTGWQLAQCFWRAGVSRNVLQFLPCDGAVEGRRLTGNSGIDYVILTGGTDTGMEILRSKPDLFLMAETGGKNATIVTAMADRDQAVANVIHSAFSNSGQKCSATSLLVLEREVYEEAAFKKQLVDAARSYRTGSAWDFDNRMGPLIRPPGKDLLWALTE